MKIINLVLAVMFLVFAFVQINDPDPVLWILIYGSMAVVCILAAFKYYPKYILAGMLILAIVYAFTFLPGIKTWLNSDNQVELFDDIAKMQHPYIEESREFLGLLICAGVIIMHLILAMKVKKGGLN